MPEVLQEMGTHRGSTQRLMLLSGSVMLFHVMTSLVQEAVFYLPGFHHTGLLTFSQALCVTLFAAVQLCRSSPVNSTSPWRRIVGARRVPLRIYFMISIMNTTSVYLTNEASRLLTYSTQVIFKSSKLLFVWLVRYIAIEIPAQLEAKKALLAQHENENIHNDKTLVDVIENEEEEEQKQQYITTVRGEPIEKLNEGVAIEINTLKSSENHSTARSTALNRLNSNIKARSEADRHKTISEILACVTVVVGLVVFTYATTSTQKSKDKESEEGWWPLFAGVAGIVIALFCDAFMYLGEEKYCFMAYNASHDEVQFFVFLLSSMNGIFSLIMSGAAIESIDFVSEQPMFITLLIFCSFFNYSGTYFLLRIISEFNSSTATVITSLRKMVTVLLSYIVYPKPFGVSHFIGVFLVLGGIWRYEEVRKMHSASAKTEKNEVIDSEENE